jgi:hypothetical protein
MIENTPNKNLENGLNAIETLEQIVHETPGNPRERQKRIDELKETERARNRGERVISATDSTGIITT